MKQILEAEFFIRKLGVFYLLILKVQEHLFGSGDGRMSDSRSYHMGTQEMRESGARLFYSNFLKTNSLCKTSITTTQEQCPHYVLTLH